MRNTITRRQFVARSSSLIAAASLGLASPFLPSANAIDPFVRTRPGPMKLGLAAYSFRDALTKPNGDVDAMDLFGFIDYCRDHGVAGAELTSYYFPENFDEDYLLKLRRHAHLQGVSISGGAIRNDFCVAPEDLEAQLEVVRRWVDAYAILGTPAIRIFAGSPPKGVSRAEAIQRCISACEQACDYAGQKGVFLALENHHGITDTAESMLQVVEGVRSDWFGVNFDSGNFKLAQDPYAELASIAPYAINAQIKIEIWEGDKKVLADLPRMVGILKGAGYGGWVVLEYEGSEPAKEAIPGHLRELAELIG